MAKVIVYCADGTSNGSGDQGFLEKDKPQLSNVYRIFQRLSGIAVSAPKELGLHVAQKDLVIDGELRQTSMYCHGVGENKHNWEQVAIGGVVGGGSTTRIRMGYTFISRQYEPGDAIVIIGFSRGAYSARALADFIADWGLLPVQKAQDHLPLSFSAGAWLEYRKAHRKDRKVTKFSRVVERSEDLHFAAVKLRRHIPKPTDYRAAPVEAIGVFDTVGSIGLPDIVDDALEDDYQFVSTTLHSKIGHAFHAISVDERRFNFQPTLWLQASHSRMVQMLFPGAHSDVGGSYDDHKLADVPLRWMVDNLNNVLTFSSVEPDYSPNELGTSHEPWKKFQFRAKPRTFPDGLLTISLSVRNRQAVAAVPVAVDDKDAAVYEPYTPANLPA